MSDVWDEYMRNEGHDDPGWAPWWTLHDSTIREALEKVASGVHPEVVYVELVATCKKEQP